MVLILQNKDTAKVCNFMEQHSLTLHVGGMKLTLNDERILSETLK